MARFNGFQLGKELSRVKNLVHLLFRFLSLIKKPQTKQFLALSAVSDLPRSGVSFFIFT